MNQVIRKFHQQSTIFIAGQIYTAFQPQVTKVECMVIKDGLIEHSGTIEGSEALLQQICPPEFEFKHVIQSSKDPGYRSWTFGGIKFVFTGEQGMILPGFIDSHLHPFTGAIQLKKCRVFKFASWAIAAEEITKYIDQLKPSPDEWIFVYGFSQSWFNELDQTIDLLDKICPNNPILISRNDYHAYWFNSVLLKLSGITPETEPKQYIHRDSKGQLNGYVSESAMSLMQKYQSFQLYRQCKLPKFDTKTYTDILQSALDLMIQNGIVGFCDAAVKENLFDTYLELYSQKQNIPWCNMSIGWNKIFFDQSQSNQMVLSIEVLQKMIQRYQQEVDKNNIDGNRLWCRTVKLFLDGVIESKTALMNRSYKDCDCKHGNQLIDQDVFEKTIQVLADLGLQAHIHSIGDKATDIVIEALKKVNPQKLQQMHNYVAHLQFVSKEAISQFKQFYLGANFTPVWFYEDPAFSILTQFLEEEQIKGMYPIKSLSQEGVQIGFGSDWPVSTISPIKGIEVAITRQPHGHEGQSLPITDLDQRITLNEALHFYTLGSAQLTMRDHLTGSLEKGKVGDFVVLSADLFKIKSNEIHKTEVLATYIGGKMVYDGGLGTMVTEIF